MSFNRPLLLSRLALQDLWHDRIISFCIVSSLVAVIAPLLLLFGLRFGIISQLQDDLANDPRNLEIRMLSSGSYDQGWVEQLRQRPDVGFAIGQTRSLNTLADLQVDSSHFIENAEVIPTDIGDPLLGKLEIQHENEIILTQEAARKLAVNVGDTLTLRVSRQLEERREWGRKDLTVVGILPATYFNRAAIFTQPTLLLMLEHFRDGYAISALGVTSGQPSAKPPLYARARLYAKSIDYVASLESDLRAQRIETTSRLADIENVKSINRVLGVIFNTIAATALIGCIASLIGSFIANVDRKRKHIAVLRLLGFTSTAVGGYVILQGCLLSLLAYVGGYSIYLIASQIFNRVLAGSQATDQMLCKITLGHSFLAMAITVVVALLVASIGAYRAIIIEPAQSLREV
ncbi:TPA: ABC transporter permease [Yersinia enterocolitica]|uniref:ABC transporter permease n=1 Tax=Yersinia enterocolitica TaxID=630 RepID=UPI0005FCF394|nr:FtsX-like permease family protein [Yersinia enterocolitica]EKN5934551.1 ABC transporter permease [Yersinia enterocolitica]ELX2275980.1 ABC transporter permease [Yersinia enterocolitica]ELY5258296.1 ABC transporter permease [Yersinia enterocolitica]CRE81531.1 acidobacterial duplicated orphan permease [Yersinia enterocolitica]HDL6630223.1 ABC transporter permease [Yersinia enterocolitica]